MVQTTYTSARRDQQQTEISAAASLVKSREEAFWQELLVRDRPPRIMLTLIYQIVLWGNLFISKRGALTGLPVIIGSSFSAVLFVVVLIQGRAIFGMFETIFDIEFTFSSIIAIFSTLYWNYGSTLNFSHSLSRLDAVYFTVGTLSTAGTGNLVATSQLARGVQTVQMLVDIGLIVFAVTLVLAALLSRRGKRS